MIPKPTYKPKKPPLHIPAKIEQQVRERDCNLCRLCGAYTLDPLHHIWSGGMGRRRVHALWNLIVICGVCHTELHSGRWSETLQEELEQWSIEEYGE